MSTSRAERSLLVNPCKRIRLEAKYTIDRLASEANISRQTIISTENGQYTKPPAAVVSALYIITRDPDVLDTLQRDYRQFQRETRKLYYGVLINPPPKTQVDVSGYIKHPIVQWAQASNIPYTRISKLYCVHQGLLDRLKNQHNLMTHLPSGLTDALMESGYPLEVLTTIEDQFQVFKESERTRISSEPIKKEGSRP